MGQSSGEPTSSRRCDKHLSVPTPLKVEQPSLALALPPAAAAGAGHGGDDLSLDSARFARHAQKPAGDEAQPGGCSGLSALDHRRAGPLHRAGGVKTEKEKEE